MARRYENTGTYKTPSGKVGYLPTKYPSLVPSNNDTYIIARAEDRLDLIATDFYGDPTLWWVVAMANDLPGDSMNTPLGFQLRIPGNLNDALNAYDQSNTI
jgi:nucleoid-associated protein YgaU